MSNLNNVTINKDGIVKLDLTKKSVRAKVQEVAKRFANIPTIEDKNMKIDLPETISAKLYVVCCPATNWVGLTTSSMESVGFVTLSSQDITVAVPQNSNMEALKEAMSQEAKDKLKKEYLEAMEKLL